MSTSFLRDATPIDTLAAQTGFSPSAVESMHDSLVRGGGRMAQFDHPEFGGAGQWMRGGMLMIADFSNADLKRRVGALCEALATRVANDATFESRETSGDRWYPAALGRPDSSGAQDATRYAWFGDRRRLAIDRDGHVTIHDTGDHRIGGIAQQQGAHATLTFTSQHGPVDVASLPVVTDHVDPSLPTSSDPAGAATNGDPFAALEKLADLHARGIVDAGEFAAKKAELLARI